MRRVGSQNCVGNPANGGLGAGRRYITGKFVSRYPRDELSALERRSDPAWLWDVDRARIVWANRPGLVLWGEVNVLDLIDRRMDRSDPAIQHLGRLAETLEPGASTQQTLVFDIGGIAETVKADCRHVLLEDGRTGLLMVRIAGEAAAMAPGATRASLLEAVMAHLPYPIAVFDRHGSLLYQNEAASEGFSSGETGADTLASDDKAVEVYSGGSLFASWLSDDFKADALMGRALSRGSFSEIATVHTKFGPRAHRINARRLAAPVVGQLAVLLAFDDIEDRRRYERRQSESIAAVEAVLGAADATFEIDAKGRLADIGGAAETVLGKGIGVLIGTPWDDVLAALEVNVHVPMAQRLASGQAWREVVWSAAAGAPALALSAVPIRSGDATPTGFRGLILALDTPLLDVTGSFESGRGVDDLAAGVLATEIPAAENRVTDDLISNDPGTGDLTLDPGPELDEALIDDEEEFLADLKADRDAARATGEGVSSDPEPSETPAPEPGTDRARSSEGRGKVGRDDAATFSAIDKALGSARKSSETLPVDPPPSGTTLRVVGGVEAPSSATTRISEQKTSEQKTPDQKSPGQKTPEQKTAAPKSLIPNPPIADMPAGGPATPNLAVSTMAPANDLLDTGKPTLIHRHFAILGVNDQLAECLGHGSAQTMLQDANLLNLLNLLPDERARLFSLQSRFDDQDLPQKGQIGGIALKARRKDRTTQTFQATFEEIIFDDVPAIRVVLELVSAGHGSVTTDEMTTNGPASSPAGTAIGSDEQQLQEQPPVLNTPMSGAAPEAQNTGEAALTAAIAREAELRAVINTAADGIITIDDAGQIMTLNASAEAIFGVSAPDRVGQKFGEMFVADDAHRISAYLTSVTSGDTSRLTREGHEVRGKRPDGAEIPLFVTIGHMKVDQGLRYCAVIRDISQWKETEDGLRLAKERAEEDSAKKSDFLARISHELRTPLNAIIGFSEVMSEEKFGPIANDRYKGYLHDIRSSGDHLLSLINDLLDLSKIEAGKLDLNFTSVDVAHLVAQGVTILQPQANQARVIVRVSLPDHLPPVVADERSLRQIVLNLLSNAVKFTPPGGQVILSAVVDEHGQLQIRVRDTGVGMSEDEIDRAMEPFRQIDGQSQSNHAGTGLGLPLTKALTEANRAEFQIESTPSAGTLVNITFPTNRVLDG